MGIWACVCDHLSLPIPLPGPGVSSSRSFEEEEEEEDENSSSSSQLNSNTRPSSATSRKSTRVRHFPAQQECGQQASEVRSSRLEGNGSEEMESWLSRHRA